MINIDTATQSIATQLLSADYRYIIESTKYSQVTDAEFKTRTAFASADWDIDPANQYISPVIYTSITSALGMVLCTDWVNSPYPIWDASEKPCCAFLKTSSGGSITNSMFAEIHMYPLQYQGYGKDRVIRGACGIVLASTASGTLSATVSDYRFATFGYYWKYGLWSLWLCYWGKDPYSASTRPARRVLLIEQDKRYTIRYERNYEYIWKVYYKIGDNNLRITLNNVLIAIDSGLTPAPTRLGILGVGDLSNLTNVDGSGNPDPLVQWNYYTCNYFKKVTVT